MKAFLSYSRDDGDLVRRLRADLQAMGVDVWIDEELLGGQLWWTEILNRIADCELFVIAVSKSSLGTEACLSESTYASEMNKPMVPVRIDHTVEPSSAPAPLVSHQWIDYLGGERDELLNLCKAVLSIETRPPTAAPRPLRPPVPGAHLRELRTAIDETHMPIETQAAVTHRIRQLLNGGRDVPTLLELARALRDRTDLFASVADEIDDLLAATASGSDSEDDPIELNSDVPQPALSGTKLNDSSAFVLAVIASSGVSSKDLYLHPNIPVGKLSKAKVAAAVPADDQIVALVDCTVFGSSKDCILFGTRGFYAKGLGTDPVSILYSEIDPATIRTKFPNKVVVGNQEVDTAGANVSRKEIEFALRSVIVGINGR